MADQAGGNSNSTIIRDYRKGNWTLGETMVLIEAKKMDDERRMKRSSENHEGGGGIRTKPAELRWKWVEDYCWRKGCLRSQNQCNDKWDNLMRDYKKIRDYERRLAQEIGLLINNNNTNDNEANKAAAMGPLPLSYWKLEKIERKDKNLPSNMLLQVYEALVEVMERKSGGGGGQRLMVTNPSSSNNNNNPNFNYGVVERLPLSTTAPVFPPLLQHQVSVSIPLSPPPQTQAQPQPLPALLYSQPLPAALDETSEYSDTPAKRRRRRKIDGGDQARSGGATMEMGSAISRSASVIAEAIQSCEESIERRHRDLLNLQERRLQIEESNSQTNTQSINALIDAINNLANSILALASHRNKS